MKIYATDVDEEALNQGRLATYPDHVIGGVPGALLKKYFERVNDRWVFHRELRRSVIFGRHDLILDPPISRVTLLTCRNTLMYFNAEVQQRILERFHFGIHNGGFLFLGKAEMLLTRSNTFAPVDLKKRIFVKVSRDSLRNGAGGLLPLRGNDVKETMIMDRLRELTFQTDASAQIVIDQARSVILLNDRVRTLFGLTNDDIGKPLQDLEISFRPVELRSMIEEAWRDRRTVCAKEIEWLPSDRLRHPVRQCLSGDSVIERLQMPATNRRGRSVMLDVTCAPFALGNDSKWGAIITMEEQPIGEAPSRAH